MRGTFIFLFIGGEDARFCVVILVQVHLIVFSRNSITGVRVPGGWASHISRQSPHWGGKVVSPTHLPSLYPRRYSCYTFLFRNWIDSRAIMQTEGLRQQRIPMTPSGIEPATFLASTNCSTVCPPVLMCKYNTFVPWRWRQQLPQERWNLSTEPQNAEGRNMKHSALQGGHFLSGKLWHFAPTD